MQNTQNKAEAYIYLYIPVHILPFHHSGKKKKATSEPLSLSQMVQAIGQKDAPVCPMFHALPLHI